MTTVSEPPPETRQAPFDPDDFRMTIGEHLEELRKRLIYGLLGVVVAVIFFLIPSVGNRIISIFCAPLVNGLRKHTMTPQLHVIGLTEGFMTYLQICMICALIVAGPWLVFQLWLFVAAGLYPHERRTITKYIPLSVALMVTGVLFVYFLVLPLTIDFFLTFNSEMPVPGMTPSPQVVTKAAPVTVPMLDGDLKNAPEGAIWINLREKQLKLMFGGDVRVIQFGATNLIASTITLDDYIGFVLTFMLVFAVAFQLPLVQLALVRVGLIEIEFLKSQRKIVYFVMTIVAAVMAPGDVVTSMLALLVPLLVLYEFGIWLAQWGQRQREREQADAP